MPGRMSLSQQYWHLGSNNSLWLCICRGLSSVPGLHPPDANSILAPNSDHQKWLQTLPTSPGGKITPSWKTLLYNMTKNLDADPLKQQTSLSMTIKSTTSDFLNAVTHLTRPPLHPFTLGSNSNFPWCLLQRSPPQTQPEATKRWVEAESWNLAR